MLGDATLKLVIGALTGVAIYYTYKKKYVKQDRLDKPFKIGKPLDAQYEFNREYKKPHQKQGAMLKKSFELI